MAVDLVSGHAEVRCVARDANVFSGNRHLSGLGRGSSHPTISPPNRQPPPQRRRYATTRPTPT
jgi:hypothetical protein